MQIRNVHLVLVVVIVFACASNALSQTQQKQQRRHHGHQQVKTTNTKQKVVSPIIDSSNSKMTASAELFPCETWKALSSQDTSDAWRRIYVIAQKILQDEKKAALGNREESHKMSTGTWDMPTQNGIIALCNREDEEEESNIDGHLHMDNNFQSLKTARRKLRASVLQPVDFQNLPFHTASLTNAIENLDEIKEKRKLLNGGSSEPSSPPPSSAENKEARTTSTTMMKRKPEEFLKSIDDNVIESCSTTLENILQDIQHWREEFKILQSYILRSEEDCVKYWPHVLEVLVDAAHLPMPNWMKARNSCWPFYQRSCGTGREREIRKSGGKNSFGAK